MKYDKRRYKRRNRIKIRFGKLKDWRRVATRYDRGPKVFLSAIVLAAIVIYWISVLTLGYLYISLYDKLSVQFFCACQRNPSQIILFRV